MKCLTVVAIVGFTTFLVPGIGMADVPPPQTPGKTYVSHAVHVENMKAHPSFSILVYDPPSREGMIQAALIYHAETEAKQTLVRGRSWRSMARFGAPKIWLMPREAQRAWSEVTAKEVSKQRQACAERGEGCAHISRFSPRFAPPKGAIDCGVSIEVYGSVPDELATKDREVKDIYRILEATPKRCKIEHVKQAVPKKG